MLVPEDSLGDIPSLEPPPGVGRLGEAAEGASARPVLLHCWKRTCRWRRSWTYTATGAGTWLGGAGRRG